MDCAPSYTHDAVVLGKFGRFVAINGALDVDLTGQVNTETASGRHIGGAAGRWILSAPPIARSKAARSSRCNPRTATAAARASLRVWRPVGRAR